MGNIDDTIVPVLCVIPLMVEPVFTAGLEAVPLAAVEKRDAVGDELDRVG